MLTKKTKGTQYSVTVCLLKNPLPAFFKKRGKNNAPNCWALLTVIKIVPSCEFKSSKHPSAVHAKLASDSNVFVF